MTPNAKLRFMGRYDRHEILIYEDSDEQPWLVVFESTRLVDAEGRDTKLIIKNEARERTLGAAKNTALALARNEFHKKSPYQEHIEWQEI
jgi:hypothetical protein